MLETLNEITLLVDEPLKNVTFTKTGGPADVLALPKTKKEVEEIVAYCREQGLSWLVLGNASNLIVRDGGIRDVVIMLTEMKEIKVAGTTMIVDAGAKLIDTTYEALAADLTGFEFACGIPGSVGGAVYMNAGAYGGEIKDVFQSAEVLLAPLTDFALLFKQYPEVKENIAEIVIMGGNIGHGNHSPFAEYNIAGDPEAAQVVFHSGLPVKVAPLEIGNKAHLTPEQMDKVKTCGEVGNMLYSLFSNIHEPDGDPRIKIYDPTAVGIMLHPEMFTMKKANVNIELRGQYTYGASVMDFMDQEHANAEIATDVDLDKFATWFIDSIKKADQGRE